MKLAAKFALIVIGERSAERPHAIISSGKKTPNVSPPYVSLSLRGPEVMRFLESRDGWDQMVNMFSRIRDPLQIPLQLHLNHPLLARDLARK
eukprot:15459198-Alexandrium_andersonii.AAC.1